MAPRPHNVQVHISDGNQLLEWRPSSIDTPIGDLIELLRENGYGGEFVELVEQSTGQPVDALTTAESLDDATIVKRNDLVTFALHQPELIRTQVSCAFDFEQLPNSSVIRVELRYPGPVERNTHAERRVFVGACHQLLMFLPASFPEKAPLLIWLTPIFHPNLLSQEQVWPPGFTWAESPNLLSLFGAVIETLLGARALTRGPLQLTRRRTMNPEASSWFRKRRKALVGFAENTRLSAGGSYDALPLNAAGAEWRVSGPLTGGCPLVFFSDRASQALREWRRFTPAWLLGEQGASQGVDWFYVDALFPAAFGGFCPQAAVGILATEGVR